jgi:hypothetical protein
VAHQGLTAQACPDNHNLLSAIIFSHLSFSVDSQIKARMMLIIQKRTMIFGSGQPFNSK